MRSIITLICALGLSFQSHAQQDAPNPILIIYHASGSMWCALDGKTTILLPTDGIASCDGDISELVTKAKVEGLSINPKNGTVVIKAGKTTSLSHDFESGKALIGLQTANGKLIDAVINFANINTKAHVLGSKTYTSANNNPKEFLLDTGAASDKSMTLRAHKGQTEAYSTEVKRGETITKIMTF